MRLALLPFIFVCAIYITGDGETDVLAPSAFASENSEPVVAIHYFDENVLDSTAYRAVLSVSGKATITTPLGLETTLENEEIEFLLSHSFDTTPPSEHPEGSFIDAGVATLYYDPYISARDTFTLIPGSSWTPSAHIEEYINSPKPGVYPLRAGQPFVLAEIEDNSYTITVDDIDE